MWSAGEKSRLYYMLYAWKNSQSYIDSGVNTLMHNIKIETEIKVLCERSWN